MNAHVFTFVHGHGQEKIFQISSKKASSFVSVGDHAIQQEFSLNLAGSWGSGAKSIVKTVSTNCELIRFAFEWAMVTDRVGICDSLATQNVRLMDGRDGVCSSYMVANTVGKMSKFIAKGLLPNGSLGTV